MLMPMTYLKLVFDLVVQFLKNLEEGVTHSRVGREDEPRLHILKKAVNTWRLTGGECKIVLDNPGSKDLQKAFLVRYMLRMQLAFPEKIIHNLRAGCRNVARSASRTLRRWGCITQVRVLET